MKLFNLIHMNINTKCVLLIIALGKKMFRCNFLIISFPSNSKDIEIAQKIRVDDVSI